jgi:hypothetical protein
MSNGQETRNEDYAALEHARAFLLQEADQRGRNFNYFIVISGAIVAALIKTAGVWIHTALMIAWIIVTWVFWVIDKRNFRLILDARAELYRLEPLFGIELHHRDWLPDPERTIDPSQRPWWQHLTIAYQAVFLLAVIAAVIGIVYVWWLRNSGDG